MFKVLLSCLIAGLPLLQAAPDKAITLPKAGAKATVLVFTMTDCPIANSYVPELERLSKAYGSQGVAFFRIYPDPSLTQDAIDEHTRAFAISIPELKDPEQKLVAATGVHVTPEAVVLDADGKIYYRGRIDDRYVALGKYRQKATTHDLQDAIEGVLAGKDARKEFPPAVGCAIPDAKEES